jgi:DNA-binding transcriptional LysR family regulator
MLTIDAYVQEGHPHIPLYTDEHAVICWSEGAHKGGLSPESFFAAGHVVAFFGRERHPAFTETYFTQQGINRKIDVRLPSFSALPHAVVGTDRLATMYRRHAETFAELLPITIHEPPVFMPAIQEDLQWHSSRSSDSGLQWLIALMRAHAQKMSNPLLGASQENGED